MDEALKEFSSGMILTRDLVAELSEDSTNSIGSVDIEGTTLYIRKRVDIGSFEQSNARIYVDSSLLDNLLDEAKHEIIAKVQKKFNHIGDIKTIPDHIVHYILPELIEYNYPLETLIEKMRTGTEQITEKTKKQISNFIKTEIDSNFPLDNVFGLAKLLPENHAAVTLGNHAYLFSKTKKRPHFTLNNGNYIYLGLSTPLDEFVGAYVGELTNHFKNQQIRTQSFMNSCINSIKDTTVVSLDKAEHAILTGDEKRVLGWEKLDPKIASNRTLPKDAYVLYIHIQTEYLMADKTKRSRPQYELKPVKFGIPLTMQRGEIRYWTPIHFEKEYTHPFTGVKSTCGSTICISPLFRETKLYGTTNIHTRDPALVTPPKDDDVPSAIAGLLTQTLNILVDGYEPKCTPYRNLEELEKEGLVQRYHPKKKG